MTETIKYAIIGAGCMGQEHILNIELIDDAEVVALCDEKAEDIQPVEKKPLIQEIKVESKPKREIPTRASNDPRDKN